MLNKYLHGFREPEEQQLLQELTTEIIQIYGIDVYYIQRTIENLNTILGEDPTSVFENVYTIEMLPESIDGFEGDKNFLNNLGLNINKTYNLIVSDERFKEVISKGPFNIPNPNIDLNIYETIRPMEGDLIFFPLTKGLFEIKFADHEAPDFYQLGKIYKWRITMEMFKYSNEVINTGIPEIDQIAIQFSNNNSVVNDPLADNDTLTTEVDNFLTTEGFEEGSFQGGVFN
jgi:hypothetical protein